MAPGEILETIKMMGDIGTPVQIGLLIYLLNEVQHLRRLLVDFSARLQWLERQKPVIIKEHQI